jgi:hypothetical protein
LLLRDYANRKTCSIYGPNSPTTVPYTQNATSNILDVEVVKVVVLPVYLNICSALSSDHLPVLIDDTRRSFFQNLLDRPEFKRMDWAAFHAFLDDRLPGNPVVNDEETNGKCVEELTSTILRATAASALKRQSVPTRGPLYPLVFSMRYA